MKCLIQYRLLQYSFIYNLLCLYTVILFIILIILCIINYNNLRLFNYIKNNP